MKYILDTDIGTDVDDAFALIVLVKMARKNLFGVVTTNGPTLLRAYAAKTLLRKSFNNNIPVFEGKSSPLSLERGNFVTGKEVDCVEFSGKIFSKQDLLFKINNVKDQSLTLICTGPLTTAAWLLSVKNVKPKIACIFIMGGALSDPTIPRLEHNFVSDPLSVKRVFQSSVPIFLLPLNFTLQFPLHQKVWKLLKNNSSATGKLLTHWGNNWLETTTQFSNKDKILKNKIYLHDPLTCMAALQPNLFEWKNVLIAINSSGVLTAGKGFSISIASDVNIHVIRIIDSCINNIN